MLFSPLGVDDTSHSAVFSLILCCVCVCWTNQTPLFHLFLLHFWAPPPPEGNFNVQCTAQTLSYRNSNNSNQNKAPKTVVFILVALQTSVYWLAIEIWIQKKGWNTSLVLCFLFLHQHHVDISEFEIIDQMNTTWRHHLCLCEAERSFYYW